MSPVVAEQLHRDGVDVVWAGDWPEDPGDPAILERAYREGRVLITHDKDFGELAILHQHPHVGIVRIIDIPVTELSYVCQRTVTFYARELADGAILTVENRRTRVRLGAADEDA
jgi:predicted nuclease of predicted toxin-antitoxin system